MTQEEKQMAFGKYDWVADEKWNKHLSRVYPEPEGRHLEKLKRHWY